MNKETAANIESQISEADNSEQLVGKYIAEIDELKKKNDFFYDLLDKNPACISSFLPGGKLTFVNDRLASIVNKKPEELVGANFFDFMDENEAQTLQEKLTALDKDHSVEIHDQSMSYFDGRVGTFEWINQACFDENGEISHFYSVGVDITKRKDIEILSKSRNEAFDEAQTLARIGSWFWTISSNEIQWSKTLYEIIGYDAKLPPLNFAEQENFYSAESFELLSKAVNKAVSNGDPFELKLTMIRVDGKLLDVIIKGRASTNSFGAVIKLNGTLQDVTEYNELKKAKQESQEFALNALNSLTANIAILNGDGQILAVNQAWQDFYASNKSNEIDQNAFVGFNYLSICDASDDGLEIGAKIVSRGIKSVIAREQLEFSHEYACHSPNEKRWFNIRVTPFLGSNEKSVVVAHENITFRKEMEEALRKSEKNFINIMYESEDAILLIEGGVVFDCNDSALKMFGLDSKANLLMSHPSNFSPRNQPDGKNSLDKSEEMMSLASNKGYNRFEWVFKSFDGKVLFAEVSFTPIVFEGRSILFSVCRDLTENKNEEKMLNLRNLCLSSISQGVLITNIDRKIVYLNKACEVITGYSEAELLGLSGSILHGEKTDVNTLNKIRVALASNESIQVEIINYRKNGQEYWNQLSISPVFNDNGEVIQYIGIQKDISASKKAEEDMKRLNIDLKRNTMIAKQLAKNAEMANKTKSLFLANMSHEMKTPLNGVIGLAQVLLDTNLTEEQRYYVELIESSGKDLDHLTRDILDISKIEANQVELEIEDFDLQELFDRLLDGFRSILKKKNLVLNLFVDQSVKKLLTGDPVRLEQVLSNLVSNAVKFTDKGNIKIDVVVETEIEDEVVLKFMITDTGVGIPSEKHNLLFKLFSQVDPSATRKHGGTGLGLSLSKKLVQLMGGEIGFHSVLGEGSQFWFTAKFLYQNLLNADIEELKVENNGVEKPSDIAKRIFHGRPKNILLVEDDKSNQEVILAVLKKIGLSADVACNGIEAIAALQRKKYDLVLMDIYMPMMNGFEATKIIRKSDSGVNNRNLPIIAMTAGLLIDDGKKCIEVGMNEVLTKPLFIETLMKSLDKWLPSAKKEDLISESIKTLEKTHLSELTDVPIFDKLSMMKRLGQDVVLEKAVINAFLKDSQSNLATLKRSFLDQNFYQVSLKAHSLKGASAVVGGERVRLISGKLEDYSKKKDLNKIKEYMENLEVEASCLIETLNDELRKI